MYSQLLGQPTTIIASFIKHISTKQIMALKDKVLVTLEEISELYVRPEYAEKAIKVLSKQALIPLTVKSLCSETGNALLHLASWVSFSGDIERRKYNPRISQKRPLLERLIEEKFFKLGQEYKIREANGRAVAKLTTNNGAFGRLLYTMGVPHSEEKERKPYYSDGLPNFIWNIADAKPAENEIEEKKSLLVIPLRVLIQDRLKSRKDDWDKEHYFLSLNNHATEKQARDFGEQTIDLLNLVIGKNNGQNVFNYCAICIRKQDKKELFECYLKLSDKNLGYLVTKEPHLLKLSINY